MDTPDTVRTHATTDPEPRHAPLHPPPRSPIALLAGVIEHARAKLPNECCGLLAGASRTASASRPSASRSRNDLASPTRLPHECPRPVRGLPRDARPRRRVAGGLPLAPDVSTPVPSRRDVEENTYGETVVHLIVGLAGEAEVRAGGSRTGSGWWTLRSHADLTLGRGGVQSAAERNWHLTADGENRDNPEAVPPACGGGTLLPPIEVRLQCSASRLDFVRFARCFSLPGGRCDPLLRPAFWPSRRPRGSPSG